MPTFRGEESGIHSCASFTAPELDLPAWLEVIQLCKAISARSVVFRNARDRPSWVYDFPSCLLTPACHQKFCKEVEACCASSRKGQRHSVCLASIHLMQHTAQHRKSRGSLQYASISNSVQLVGYGLSVQSCLPHIAIYPLNNMVTGKMCG